ncbi:DUF362 domain-containing protein [Desulfonatronum lacustre]|uniref:DUF362 domain-containing protein n=1 Tax=Desulfonatronum lacustre TaxID=66849 RepID=UPI0004B33541|nr:DUF362 domain-containing protein [Desulfonatronum lacustre]
MTTRSAADVQQAIHQERPLIPVALTRCAAYEADRLAESIQACWNALGRAFRPGDTVLVKPNLVTSRRAHLSCTHPQVVRAVCVLLLDHGVRVQVGDSPAFGTAGQVARAAGLTEALGDLPVPVRNLNRPVSVRLTGASQAGSFQVGISRHVLEADLLLNLPRLKAHSQMFITAAAKNLFGCVCGVRKAVAHMRHGQGDDLAGLILDLQPHLPPTTSLLDAVTAMDVSGPASGQPCYLGLLAASDNPVALDTAVYTALSLCPEQVPLWREARRKNLLGHHPDQITTPLLSPADLDLSAFQAPNRLNPISFHPRQVVKSMCRRAWLGLRAVAAGR